MTLPGESGHGEPSPAGRKLRHEEIRRARLDELPRMPRHPIYAVVDNVRSIYNVGSIFRTSDAALISALYLCGFTPYPPRKEISKTALGATESVPWRYFRKTEEALLDLKKEKIRLCAVELTDRSIPFSSIRRGDFPLALVIGNELSGISQEALSICDCALEIPMYGVKQSLNVSVAYGIVLFSCLKLLHD